nr:unnamed protein product [Callosobruchus analis]
MSEVTDVSLPPELAKLYDLSICPQKLLIVSLLVVLIYSAIFYGKIWRWYYHSWNVPGPLAFPFIGNAYKFFGAKWKSHRKLMSRSFRQKILDGFVGTFNGKTTIFIDIVKKYIGMDDIPLFRLASRYHMDTICETTMGVTMDVQTTEDFLGSTAKRKAVLDLLIESFQLSEEELRAEVSTTLGAQKVYEEVLDVLGVEKSVESEDLLRLEYTERVIKECLRLFPPIGFISRYVSEDVDIGNYVAPAGISISIPILHIHRSDSYWEDPIKFDPDRFLPDNVAKRHPLSYMPFSYGLRNCIGWRYAMMNLTTFTARVVREFKVFTQYKSLEEIKVETHVFTEIKDGPKVRFETRT